MTLTNANQIFSQTSFQADRDTLEFPKISYVCPDGCEIVFSMKHFEKHALSNKTNLSDEDAQAIDGFMANKDMERSNSFLDFYCPNGGDAVRIYFVAWAGGHFTAGYDIKCVIRMPKGNQQD